MLAPSIFFFYFNSICLLHLYTYSELGEEITSIVSFFYPPHYRLACGFQSFLCLVFRFASGSVFLFTLELMRFMLDGSNPSLCVDDASVQAITVRVWGNAIIAYASSTACFMS